MRALGLQPEPIGEIRSDELRYKLDDPEIGARFIDADLEHYVPQLSSVAWLSHEDRNARIVWA